MQCPPTRVDYYYSRYDSLHRTGRIATNTPPSAALSPHLDDKMTTNPPLPPSPVRRNSHEERVLRERIYTLHLVVLNYAAVQGSLYQQKPAPTSRFRTFLLTRPEPSARFPSLYFSLDSRETFTTRAKPSADSTSSSPARPLPLRAATDRPTSKNHTRGAEPEQLYLVGLLLPGDDR